MDITSTNKTLHADRSLDKLFFTCTIIVAIVAVCFGIYEYQREHSFRCDILHAKLQLNNYTRKDTTIRLTIIDKHGKVLSDNQTKDISKMGNHLHRKEVVDAINEGSGYDIKRESETNGETYFYSATLINDTVVRSAVPYSAPLTDSLVADYTFFYYTAGILTLIAIVLYLRHRLSSSEKEKQRIKRQLTENAAHELKTPAATIHGYIETLFCNPDMPKEKRMEFVEHCYAQSGRMTRLLRDMSMLTQLEASPSALSNRDVDIDAAKTIRQIEEETRMQFQERGIELRIALPRHLPMKGDASLIYSLFRNIFNNTLAYATGATRFDVKIRLARDRYTFVMSDNGVGVPPEHLPHIFERFYRTDKGRSRQLGGTGLGLAIVKNIALQYDGYAKAYSTSGGGLTIEVELRV